MRLSSEKETRVESSGVDSDEHEFKMEVSSKAFSILVDKLYTNKIAATIRELSTNAYEAHQSVSKEKTPFLVTLPNNTDQNFIVRDYGPGLPEKDIYGLYTVVFKSTKANSNNVGGCFGLGSKAPLSYTKNFVVNSYFEGKKYTYAIYLNEVGIPSCRKMAEVECSEQSGLEIIVPVEKHDIQSFKNYATDIYKWFKTRPTIKGQSVTFTEEKIKTSGDGWYITDSYYGKNYAIMGNVAYALDGYSFTGKNSAILRNINGLVIEFEIGDIEPEPSRESIAFNKQTILVIDEKLEKIKEYVTKDIESQAAKCKTYWEAYFLVQSIYNNFHFLFNGFPQVKWNGEDLKAVEVNVECHTKYRKHSHNITSYVYSDRDRFYILDKHGTRSRMKYDSVDRYFIVDDVETAKELSEKMKIDVSLWKLGSQLDKCPARQRNARSLTGKVFKFKYGGQYKQSYWEDNVDIPDAGGYYVCVHRNSVIINEKEHHPSGLWGIIDEISKGTIVYGVKKQEVSKFKNNPKWKEITELIIEKRPSYQDNYFKQLAQSTLLEGLDYSTKSFLTEFEDVVKPYLKDIDFKAWNTSANKNYTHLVGEMDKLLGEETQLPKIKSQIRYGDIVENFLNLNPLLRSIVKNAYYYNSVDIKKLKPEITTYLMAKYEPKKLIVNSK